ncbi:MAG: 1-(5-phosphoribosyl)-5-[(5-phosphoribosylamino) methylideneamino]imidazole-4-carboxamide isomerase [Flammeovirgaceae bacterium]
MLEIIPAIDLIGGKCVRLTQGDYSKTQTYHENPVEVAKMFEQHGIKRLHLVDLDGAKHKKLMNLPVLEAIAKETNLWIDYGGGIQTENDLKQIFEAGAMMATCGSIAVKRKDLFEEWLKRYGAEKLILAADVRNGLVAISGWLEQTDLSVEEFIKTYLDLGAKYFLCTDISRDGMMQGTAIDLYKNLQKKFPEMKLIASGGVKDISDLRILKEHNIFGVVVGKAIYEGKITLHQLQAFNH